ncbi:hypothetical protein C7999DRAFT_41867 [Corynascus novoguineensis]|uniref:Lytic polysaccharide monooxygenase n=1 Tax=Corynascus novoguineensis TaxID=1126955 RepID=A0AAN7CRJ4_9PEZI|nr:hypothetical protein C7999DRAFT_41867 [Corynascus novoguineensis]
MPTMSSCTKICLASLATGHMQMSYPPPLKSAFNPYTSSGGTDYDMTSPLRADGSNFPCKAYLSLLGTPQGAAVASWSAGGTYNFSVAGGASHGGGSCQASLSVDGGGTFRVLHSYQGGCPSQNQESSFQFTVPADTPASEGAVFAWTWFNNLGNREMYMNCAVVDIAAAIGSLSGVNGGDSVPVAFANRPALFVANIGNGCRTVDSTNVQFPNPGPDVDSTGATTPPVGNCGSYQGDYGYGPGANSNGGVGEGSADTTCSSSCSLSSPLGDPEVESEPYSTPLSGSDGSGKSWTPGNDWPDWFLSDAARPRGRTDLLNFVLVLLLTYCLL